MAIIHNTTMTPGKLELLAAWLPAQPWYRDTGRAPALAKVGGFRLDDPQGAAGIEFMVVTDGSGDGSTTYHVPLTYRGSALAAADGGLIGMSQHGVLGRRWIYDGTHDPVLIAQLVALIQGGAVPQAQGASDTPDPTVIGMPVTRGALTVIGSGAVANGPSGTDLRVETAAADGMGRGTLVVRFNRILRPGGGVPPADRAERPCLSATWRLPDGARVRGILATARHAQAPAARS